MGTCGAKPCAPSEHAPAWLSQHQDLIIHVDCIASPPGTILKNQSPKQQPVLILPPPLTLPLLFPCNARLAFSSTGPRALMRGLTGHALVSGDGSGLKSDPVTRLSCLFSDISEGLRGRDKALIRAALAPPFLYPGMFLHIHKAKIKL